MKDTINLYKTNTTLIIPRYKSMSLDLQVVVLFDVIKELEEIADTAAQTLLKRNIDKHLH